MQRIILAIDQSSGASSACGVAIYDPNSCQILGVHELRPSIKKPEYMRIKDILYQLKEIIDGAAAQYGPLEVRVEGVVMRGRSGQIIGWVVGGIIALLPTTAIFREVHNIRLKMFMTGSHNATKLEMGQALRALFERQKEKNLASIDAVQKLIENSNWDAIDALCIAMYDGP